MRVLKSLKMRGLDSGLPRWRRLSGRWTFDSVEGPARAARSKGPNENILLLAGPIPDGGFAVRFRILEPSTESAGGAIIYLDYNAPDDFLGFHFCPAKELVECFARKGSSWRRMGLPVHYPIGIGTEHRAEVIIEGDVRRLRLDGRDLIAIRGAATRGRLGIGAKICPVEFTDVNLLPSPEFKKAPAAPALSWVTS